MNEQPRIPTGLHENEILALIESDTGSMSAERFAAVRAAVDADPALRAFVEGARSDRIAIGMWASGAFAGDLPGEQALIETLRGQGASAVSEMPTPVVVVRQAPRFRMTPLRLGAAAAIVFAAGMATISPVFFGDARERSHQIAEADIAMPGIAIALIGPEAPAYGLELAKAVSLAAEGRLLAIVTGLDSDATAAVLLGSGMASESAPMTMELSRDASALEAAMHRIELAGGAVRLEVVEPAAEETAVAELASVLWWQGSLDAATMHMRVPVRCE